MGGGYGVSVASIRAAIVFTLAEQNLKKVAFPPALVLNQLRPSMWRAEKLLVTNFLEFHTSQVEIFKHSIEDRHVALSNLNTVVQDCISDTNKVWRGEAAEAARHQLHVLQKDIQAQAHIYEVAEHNIELGLKATLAMVQFAQAQAWIIAMTKRPIALDNVLRATSDSLMAMGGEGIDNVIGAALGKDKASKYGFKYSPGAAITSGIKGIRGGLGELVEGVKDMQRSTRISMNVLDALCNFVASAEEELDRIWTIVWSKTKSGEKLSPDFTHQLKPVKVKGVEPPTSPKDRDIKCNPNPPLKELPKFTCPVPHEDESDGHEKRKSTPEPAPQEHHPKLVPPTGGGSNGGTGGGGTGGSGGNTLPHPPMDPSDSGNNHQPLEPPVGYPPANPEQPHPPQNGHQEHMPGTGNGNPPYIPDRSNGTQSGTTQPAIINTIIQAGNRTAQMIHNELWNALMNGGMDAANPTATPGGDYTSTPGIGNAPFQNGMMPSVPPQPGGDMPMSHQPAYSGGLDMGMHSNGTLSARAGMYPGGEHTNPAAHVGYMSESGQANDSTTHASGNNPSWSLRIDGELGVEVSVDSHGSISIETVDHDHPASCEANGGEDAHHTDGGDRHDEAHHDESAHGPDEHQHGEEQSDNDGKSAHHDNADVHTEEADSVDEEKKDGDQPKDSTKEHGQRDAAESVEKAQKQDSEHGEQSSNDDASVDEKIHAKTTAEVHVHTQTAAVNQAPTEATPAEATPAEMPASPVASADRSDVTDNGLSKAGMW